MGICWDLGDRVCVVYEMVAKQMEKNVESAGIWAYAEVYWHCPRRGPSK